MSNSYDDDFAAMQQTLAAILNGEYEVDSDAQELVNPELLGVGQEVDEDKQYGGKVNAQNLSNSTTDPLPPPPPNPPDMGMGFDFDFSSIIGEVERDAPPVPPPPKIESVVTEEDSTQLEVGTDENELPSLQELIDSSSGEGGEELFSGIPKKEAAKNAIPMPSFTNEEIAEQIDIRNLATLVTLNTSRWHGKVKDKKASEYAAATAGASAEAFETQKRLLAGADESLRKVHKAIDDARTRHYKMTLPWSTTGREDQGKRKGAALLPNAKFFDYTKEMAEAKVAMENMLNEFVSSYAAAINKARANLGDRFDPNEYPHPTTIQDHFGLSFDFHPIPIGSDFQGLADQQVDKLSRKLEQKNRQMIENAMQETWTRAYQLVAQAADRFSSPDKMFHYTLIDKLVDAGVNLGSLNLTGDPMVSKVQQVIQKHLTMHDAESIRGDEALRKRLGQVATALLKEMSEHASK